VTALLAVEMRRLWSRRLVRVVIALACGGAVLAGVLVFANSRAGAGPRESFQFRWLTDLLAATSVPLLTLGWLVGASFIGADWHAGTITTQLTWEPRRLRVLAAKAAALAILVPIGCTAVMLVLGVALVPAAQWRGSFDGVDAQWSASLLSIAGRGALLALLAAEVGFAIASLARNTAAALTAGFIYLAVVESLVRALKPAWQPWLLTDNVGLFLTGQEAGVPSLGRTALDAGALLIGYAALALVLAATLFRARDVT
jgi:hypothetical protein